MRMAILWPRDHILYSYYNSYLPLKEKVIEDYSTPEVALVLDVMDELRAGSQTMETLKRMKERGTKVVTFAMDPAHFPRVDELHNCVGVDHFFVTDPRFAERYSHASCSYVDFIVNTDSISPQKKNKEKFACYYGHLNWGRKLPDYVTRLEIKDRNELMEEVSKYKFGFVFDTGADETGVGEYSYNKGKYLEYLSVGVVPVVQPAITSQKYSKFFVKMSEFNETTQPLEIPCEDIKSLNRETLDEIISKCEQVCEK